MNMIALSNSIHTYARPETKEKFLEFFTDILGLEAVESSDAMGSPEPIYAFKFSNGASLSVEFTEDALDDQQARRGAWLELRTDDATGLQQRALAAGLPRVIHPYTPFFYIQAPGGQVFRIVPNKQV
jgi:catechol 2,3-dioxygenase-like lactoylglutathione lyase family enzyme